MCALQPAFESLNLGTLRLFQALMQTGALHKAAAHLAISVATANRELGHLRDAFHDKLFVKAGHGMAPTPRAVAALPRIEAALDELERAQSSGEFDPSRTRELFQIAVADNGFLLFVGRLLPGFVRRAPLAQLKVSQLTANVYDQLRDGPLDAAIFPSEQVPPDFHCRLLADSEFVCLLRSGHPLVTEIPRQGRPAIDAYVRYPRVVYHVERGHESFDFEELALGDARLGEPTIVSPYFLGVPLLLLDSDLTTIVPRPTAEYFARILPLAILPTPIPSRPFRPRLIWHERVHASAPSRWFRSLFQTV